MLPWLMALAGTLSAKAQSSGARDQLASQIASRNAQRLGGNTDMLDAVTGRKAIANQEGQAIGGSIANAFLGQPDEPGQPPTAAAGRSLAGAAPAATMQPMAAAASPLTAPIAGAAGGAMNAMQNDPHFIDFMQRWGQR
jgi:hypothetical protein